MKILDREFEIYLSQDQIAKRISLLAREISLNYQDKNPILLSVLKGSFIFTSDLFRALTIPAEVSFIQLSSYEGLKSSGAITTKFDLNEEIGQRHVIIVDDIIDSGLTGEYLKKLLLKKNPKSIEFATLLLKKVIFKNRFPIKYVGFEVENNFLVGYGMDYKDQGRNLSAIYQLKN